jgi:hypothetical protein
MSRHCLTVFTAFLLGCLAAGDDDEPQSAYISFLITKYNPRIIQECQYESRMKPIDQQHHYLVLCLVPQCTTTCSSSNNYDCLYLQFPVRSCSE